LKSKRIIGLFRKTIFRKALQSFLMASLVICDLHAGSNSRTVARQAAHSENERAVDYATAISSLKRSVPEIMATEKALGASIALVDGERVVWAEGFGFTDSSKQTQVTPDTLFSVQSISKSYTAAAFLRAIDKGWFKLDDRFRKYVPEFTIHSRYGSDEADKITFRHLLSHWAGLPHEAPLGNGHDDRFCTFDEHIKSIPQTWLKAPVGARYSYSNIGIDLVGYCLQQRSGKPFDQFMKEELLTPLGMKSSTFNQPEAFRNPSLAKGYMGDQQVPDIIIPMIPAGGMYSNVKDMAKFVSLHLSGGQIKGRSFIPRRLLQQTYQLQFPVEYQTAGYGLGMEIKPAFGATMLGHGGSGYGYSTKQSWIPEYGIGVIVLTNAGDSGIAETLSQEAFSQMLKAKYGTVPADKPVQLTNKAVRALDVTALARLEGTYRAYSNVVAFQVENGNLHFIRGNRNLQLKAHSPTEFTADGQKFTFALDTAGNPKSVHYLGQDNVDTFLPNDRPHEAPGPNRPRWSEYVGQYQGPSFGIKYTTRIYLKNGYLYSSRGEGTKLLEYSPNLFFTTDGEAVIFQTNRMSLGNRPVTKVR
jgi:CubicO group peptidase (beta-lactamase class C family)